MRILGRLIVSSFLKICEEYYCRATTNVVIMWFMRHCKGCLIMILGRGKNVLQMIEKTISIYSMNDMLLATMLKCLLAFV